MRNRGKTSAARRFLRMLLILSVFGLLVGTLPLLLSKPRPQGVAGAEAERLANEMIASVDANGWRETGAIRFTFHNHYHLWDRRRNYDRVEFGDYTVLVRLRDRTGRVWSHGKEVTGNKAQQQVTKAYSFWVNDSFWLNPVVKIFDSGVKRSLSRDAAGANKLLVEYTSGGMTPGDAYLWTPGVSGSRPEKWEMWTSNLPIKGLSASWEDWILLKTGAWISTMHRIGPFKLRLQNVEGARDLRELLGSAAVDPFAPLQ